MTEDRLPLNELLQKAGEGAFLRAVAESVLQLLMEADVEGLIGAGRHERSADRLNWRNGYRDPARRHPADPKTTEKALVAVIQEAWIGGVVDAPGRRDRAGDGALRHLEEPGLETEARKSMSA